MKRFFILYVFAVMLFPVFPAEAKTVKVKTANGEELEFEVTRGIPEPVENDWIKITLAGFIFHTGQEDEPSGVEWAFGFTSVRDDIEKIEVYDVSENSAKLLVLDENVQLNDGKWLNSEQPPIRASEEKFPWLYDKKTTALLFEFKVYNSMGESRTLHQLAIYHRKLDKAIAKFLKKNETLP